MINKISIQDYKCLRDKTLENLGKFSVIYGANGSGKTSVCEILKAYDKGQEPPEAGLSVSAETKPRMLFFDSKFISHNVHTHGKRANSMSEGGHTQHSGQMIISLDEKAINLEKEVVKKKEALEELRTSNETVPPTEEQRTMFVEYRELSPEERDGVKADAVKASHEVAGELADLEKFKDKDKILQFLDAKPLRPLKSPPMPEVPSLEELQQISKAMSKRAYKESECPVCGGDLDPETASRLTAEQWVQISGIAHRDLETEEKSENLKETLDQMKRITAWFRDEVSERFDCMERLNQQLQNKDFYTFEQKENALDAVKNCEIVFNDGDLEGLGNDLPETLKDLLSTKVLVYDATRLFYKEFFDLRIASVDEFKESFTSLSEDSLVEKTQQLKEASARHEAVVAFLDHEFDQVVEYEAFVEKEEDAKKDLKNAEKRLSEYLSVAVPKNVIDTVNKQLENFEVPFFLDHTKGRGGTKNYSFAFNVFDRETKGTREVDNGLSSGERQVLSLGFFSAIVNLLENKENVVLVFDDPMSDLDEDRTKSLAHFLQEQSEVFGQVICFTHNPMLYDEIAKADQATCMDI